LTASSSPELLHGRDGDPEAPSFIAPSFRYPSQASLRSVGRLRLHRMVTRRPPLKTYAIILHRFSHGFRRRQHYSTNVRDDDKPAPLPPLTSESSKQKMAGMGAVPRAKLWRLSIIALRVSVWRISAQLSARLHEGQAARGKVEMGTCREFLRPSGLAFFGAAWSCMPNSKD
jgi:hypothetical protein